MTGHDGSAAKQVAISVQSAVVTAAALDDAAGSVCVLDRRARSRQHPSFHYDRQCLVTVAACMRTPEDAALALPRTHAVTRRSCTGE
jgi:hypothetical protein